MAGTPQTQFGYQAPLGINATDNQADAAAQMAAQGQLGAAQQAAQASEYGSSTQAATAAAALGLKSSEFNSAYGLLSNQIAGGNGSGSATGAGPGGLGGYNTSSQPGVTTGGIWTPGQVQQQVNQSNATGIQGAQTLQRQQANQMAGQGFGSASPALAQLQGNAMSQALASNAANAGNIQYQAAQGNAQQNLASQTQAQTGWQQAQQTDVARRALNEQYAASLAQAISGLV
jgi:hypothetical protein